MSNILGDDFTVPEAPEKTTEEVQTPDFPQTMGGGMDTSGVEQRMQEVRAKREEQLRLRKYEPQVTAGTPDMLRDPDPENLSALNEHPAYQQLAIKMYEYAKASDNPTVPMVPDINDPRDIAEWASTNYSWLEWSDQRKMMDFNKISKMPTDVLQAWNEGAKMWRNTDATREGVGRAIAGIVTSPLTWIGFGTIKAAAGGIANKAGFKYLQTLGDKIARSQSFGMKAARTLTAASAEGAAWAGGDAAYWENFASKAEGREFNSEGDVTEAAVLGGAMAPAIIAGGYGAYKGGKQAMHNVVRMYRASELGALKTITGRAGVWTDSQEAAAHYASGENSTVHAADAYPRRPMIFNQPDYSAQELIEKLDLSAEDGARLIDSTGNQARIPVKQAVDMLEDEMRKKNVDMAIIREPVEGIDAIHGLEKGSLDKGEIQSFKVLDPSILRKPSDMKPMYVPRSQRGMVGTYYHGSPAQHEKFKEEFLRTGEGHAAYGEGFYVAKNERVGQWYADKLSSNRGVSVTVKGGRQDIAHNAAVAQKVVSQLEDGGITINKTSVIDVIERDQRVYTKILHDHPDGKNAKALQKAIDDADSTIKLLNEGELSLEPAKGNLYRVKVHPKEEEFLDLDKPLEKQSDTVRAGLERLGIKGDEYDRAAAMTLARDSAQSVMKLGSRLEEVSDLLPDVRINGKSLAEAGDTIKGSVARHAGESLGAAANVLRATKNYMTHFINNLDKAARDVPAEQRAIFDEINQEVRRLHDSIPENTINEILAVPVEGFSGHDIYNRLKREHGAENIRDVLHGVGIKGNRYLDGSSRVHGDGSHNLVIFKEEDIEIRQRGDKYFEGHKPNEAIEFLQDIGVSADPKKDFAYNELHDYVDLAREHGYKGTPYDPPWHIENGRVSTRYPVGAKKLEDPHKHELHVGLDGMKKVKTSFNRNMSAVSKYPNFRSSAKTPAGRAKAMIDHVKDNLRWLYEQVPEDVRERSKRWYDGANHIATQWSDRYSMPDHAIAGIMASLSPQKEWFQNVSLAERVLDIMTHHQKTAWSDKMFDKGKEIFLDGIDVTTAEGQRKYNNRANTLALIRGKALGEIDEPYEQAMWLRIYDEAFHDRTHRVVTPEGEFGDVVKTKKGVDAGTSWGSLAEITRAVSIYKNPTLHNVSKRLGGQHKVRSFYNNIIDPSNSMDVTIDTHAVAAALLRPLSSEDIEVKHNFGGTGASSSKMSGSKGTYGLYADAYRQLADELGILPRELQSITWEAVRGLFDAGYKKANKENVDFIGQLWQNYKKGKSSLDDTRRAISEHAKGIQEPSWVGRPAGGVHGEAGYSSYAGQLSGDGIPRPYAGGAGGGAVGGNPGVPTEGINPIVVMGSTGATGAASIPFIPYSGENDQ